MWWIPALLAVEPAPEEASPEGPQTSVLLAIFESVPEKKARQKAIHVALRKAPNLHGGKDWGKVLCFHFIGDVNQAAVETGLRRAKLEGTLRIGDTCEKPPKEALMPAKAVASVLIHYTTDLNPAEVRAEFTSLLYMKLPLQGVKFASTPENPRACLEFMKEPDPEILSFALKALHLTVTDTEPVEACIPALR